MNILVIEDEPKVAAFLKEGLEAEQYQVDIAFDGMIGKKLALGNFYNLIIMDLIIPYINGLELCREIRTSNPAIPILMLTALGTTKDKVTGFEAGADDYLVKPFEFEELLVRIKSLTRRSSGIIQSGKSIKVMDLELNLDNKKAYRGGKEIDLTPKEFHLLEYLMRNKGRVLSKAEIAEKVWDLNFETGTNTVEVYINFLRRKIDKDFETKLIHTQVGMGYVLK
jgi:two-component system, OmpR family, copper resistance phosphate regulon response regulator CusR